MTRGSVTFGIASRTFGVPLAMRRSSLAVGVLIVLVFSCKSQPDDARTTPATNPPKPSTTPTPTKSVAPTATKEAPRPRYLRRLRPEKINASSVYDDKKTHEKHPAADAFDGDRNTEWAEGVEGDGKGAWIEATFSKPQKLWGVVSDTGIVVTRKTFGDVFALNAHAKSMRLVLDGADAFTRAVAADEPQIAWNGIDREISAIRIVADDVYPGSKWADFGIGEIALLTDATSAPSVPESMVQSEVDAAQSPEQAAAVLRRFGVNPPTSQLEGRTVTASLTHASLVDDLGRERVLVVSLFGDAAEDGTRAEDDWIVFLGTTADDRLIGLGSDWVSTKTKPDAPVKIAPMRFHADALDDVVAQWDHGVRAWSLQRNHLEKLVDLRSDDGVTIGEEPAPPRTVSTTGLSLKFDARAFCYR